MAFKRNEKFWRRIPQKFIDNKAMKCPICGTAKPQWSIDQHIGLISLNRYLFKCEDCGCILSATVSDIACFEGKPQTRTFIDTSYVNKTNTVYFKVENVGDFETNIIHQGQQISLNELRN